LPSVVEAAPRPVTNAAGSTSTNLDRLLARSPDLRRALVALDQSLGSSGTLDPGLAELAFLRASVVNGCGACVRRHASLARHRGLNESVVRALLSDEEGPAHALGPRERAIIRFVDALSATPCDLDRHLVDAVAEHLDGDQLSELGLIVATASALNRLVLVSGQLRS
jgi:AhpD family alkylhydroperoxidase